MKNIVSVLMALVVMFACSVCFANSSASGRTNYTNAMKIVVQAPQNSSLSYSKMPAFVLTFRTSSGAMATGTMSFYDGQTGKHLETRNVTGGTNFVPPKERRSYIVIFRSNQVAYWRVTKNTKAVGNRYFYELYTGMYWPKAVG